jgi:Spy/CpxP family protein refolding chaperone
MKKHIILILTLIIMISVSPLNGHMQEEPFSNPQYFQFMIFRMTQELSLSEQQAEKFFPMHRTYRQNKHQLHHDIITLGKEAYEKTNITKSDLTRYKNEMNRLKNAETELDASFYADLEKFLNPEQVVRFMFFDQHFRRELSRELKERYRSNDYQQKKQIRPKRNK